MILVFAMVLASRYAQVHTDLEKAHGDLQVLDKMKDDFMATTTHELKTPLHGIIGLADSMADGSLGEVNAAQQETLTLMRSSALQLKNLVGEILEFSRLRSGRADLFLETVNIEDTIAGVASLLRATIEGKDLRIETDIVGALPAVRADRNRLRQVLINLVGNAVKFTPAGTVTVLAETAGPGFVRITISDTGPGIAPRDMERIWAPFTQAEDPDTRRAGGTGLGLAISRYLVELHGGRIWAESEPGKGSSFIFELPVEPPVQGIARTEARPAVLSFPAPQARTVEPGHAGAVQAEEPVERRHHESALVLAVDDDPVSLKIVENLCALVGYDFTSAANGPEALAKLEKQDIDLVLLDIMLPGMSGYEVCRAIRTTEKGKFIPVIMVTARDAMGDLIRGFTTGANDYVSKPFNREELLVRMENQLVIKELFDLEKNVINGLKREKDDIASLHQRTLDLKESTLQMAKWESVIREDLDIAHQFQIKLMTRGGDVPGLRSHVHYEPLFQIGGDIYDIFTLRPGVQRIFLADATGHGINAALNTVKILGEYGAAKETLSAPAVIMNFLSRRFARLFSDYQIVFTAVIVDIDMEAGTATFASAGHPEQYLIADNGMEAVKAPGPVIGLSSTYEYSQVTRPFPPGTILLLYTDGLFDYFGADTETHQSLSLRPAGIFHDFASKQPPMPLDEIARTILKAGRSSSKKIVIDDDVTMLLFRRD